MYLFDKRFVHFMWDDELKGKKCFVADNINTLIECVKEGTATYKVHWSGNIGMPIECDDHVRYHFVYYDPNYEVKKAFNEGKKIQVRRADCTWKDCDEPKWYDDSMYRVKPDCPCDDGLDSKVCVGCEHSEDGKRHPFENYHCYGCDKSSKKKYRPYKDSAEMIADFTARFKVKCPPYAEPLIWVKHKKYVDHHHLITGFGAHVHFGGGVYNFEALFECFTYLDGSPVGREIVE